jgi:ferredoxin
MAKLIFDNTGEETTLQDGEAIAHACEEAGVPFACTEGICGTCIVEVIDGMENLTAPTQAETDFLGEFGTAKERMACQCKIKCGDVKITF